jgi:hypothetical protein
MASAKNGTKKTLIEEMQGRASWLASHADALSCYGQKKEADVEWLRAGGCAEEVACLLDADNQSVEAAVQFVSAASCFARVKHYSHAVALLRSALSFPLREVYRHEVEGLLEKWLPKAKNQLRRQARKQPVAVS